MFSFDSVGFNYVKYIVKFFVNFSTQLSILWADFLLKILTSL